MSSDCLTYAVVGHGWRADFYFALARRLPALFKCVGAVTRKEEAGLAVESTWGVPSFRSIEDLFAQTQPEVVVTCVPRSANREVVTHLVGRGAATLSETPPAQDVDDLRRLWTDVGASGLVQVAEQHPFLPSVAALRSLISSGRLGTPSSASVSWTHDYHAIAMLRAVLGVSGVPAMVQAVASTWPLLEGPDRAGWPQGVEIKPTQQTLALLDFSGATGVYDFTDGQWFNPLRLRSLHIQGSLGSATNRAMVRNVGGRETARSVIDRRHLGNDGELGGFDLDTLTCEGATIYKNPYQGARLSDEEIAIATCLDATGRWVRGEGPPPYPLADACQDQLLALAIHEAAKFKQPVVTEVQPWAGHLGGAMAPDEYLGSTS